MHLDITIDDLLQNPRVSDVRGGRRAARQVCRGVFSSRTDPAASRGSPVPEAVPLIKCHSLCGALCELPRDRSERPPAEWSTLFEEYDLLNENTDIIPDEGLSETVWSSIRCTDVPSLRALLP